MNFHTALVQLPLVRETSGARLVTPADVYRVCQDIAELAQECFMVITVNNKHKMINRHLVSLGIADASLVHCREVFRPAIHDGAMNILVAHNHPSGDPTPSSEDVQITRKLVDAGRIIGIELLDHVIIGRPMKPVGNTPATPPFLSLREAGLCAFE